MKRGTFDSASGLKPMSAYVVVGVVLAMAAGRLFQLASAEASAADFVREVREERAPEDYRIVDREGRVLAASQPAYDLLLSPQVMWQNHTPLRIANSIAGALGQDERWASELVDVMLPAGPDGWRRVDAWPLTDAEAARLGDWITGSEMHGFSVEREREGDAFLWWKPREVLSEAERERHFERVGPSSWTRFLTRGIYTARHGNPREQGERLRYDAKLAGEEVWTALLPEVHNVPLERITPTQAMAVQAALSDEMVSRDHMRLVLVHDREHPVGEFPTLGSWGFTRDGQERPDAYVGLELRAQELAAEHAALWASTAPATYEWVAGRVSRRGATPYFQGSADAAPPIVVETTIDTVLQRRTREALEDAVERHDATLAMAIVVEVRSGEVLALDAVSTLPTRAFLPVAHLFTPGSTFKLVTMAMGLDAGVVDPRSSELGVGRFDVGHGRDWRVPVPGRSRTIDEAEGAPTGVQSLAACLAWSINAGMAQVGLKLSPEAFRGKLLELGYGQPSRAGLGGESFWPFVSLEDWDLAYEQASISFGHNVSVNLWQHAEGLATILRDGVWKPHVLVRAVSQGERSEAVVSDRGAPRRVFRPGVGVIVRDMMTLGAREGTGRHIVRDDIEMGTKTGTTWKEDGVLSTRVELEALAAHIYAGNQPTNAEWRAERKALQAAHRFDKNEYTSSVIAVGHLPGGDPSDEVMVLVVVDEPREGKFGSQVAGPTAVALLAEALGVTRRGEAKEVVLEGGVLPLELDAAQALEGHGAQLDRPWMRFLRGDDQ